MGNDRRSIKWQYLTKAKLSMFCIKARQKLERSIVYPYEEPPKQRITNRQLAEWLAKGNGEYSYLDTGVLSYTEYSYEIRCKENKDVEDEILIRPWDSKV